MATSDAERASASRCKALAELRRLEEWVRDRYRAALSELDDAGRRALAVEDLEVLAADLDGYPRTAKCDFCKVDVRPGMSGRDPREAVAMDILPNEGSSWGPSPEPRCELHRVPMASMTRARRYGCHGHRPWITVSEFNLPPQGVVDPCLSCGLARADH